MRESGYRKLSRLAGLICVICGFSVFSVVNLPNVEANNVQLANAVLQNPAGGKVTVQFKLSQENPFGNVTFDNIAFSDYVWVFVKFSTTNGSDGSWRHATLAAGGGVAGIQASLDLANAGYQVYLVEKKPYLGGLMAQIAKTYPTMDCSL